MAWKGTINRIERTNNGSVAVIIVYTNGTTTFDETFVTDQAQDDNWIDENIKLRLAKLETLDIYEQNLKSKNIVLSDVTLDDI